jgi:hypothetical protein
MTKPVLFVAIASLTLPLMAIPVLKKRTPESHQESAQVPSSGTTAPTATVPVTAPAAPAAVPSTGEKPRTPRAPSGLRVKFQ